MENRYNWENIFLWCAGGILIWFSFLNRDYLYWAIPVFILGLGVIVTGFMAKFKEEDSER